MTRELKENEIRWIKQMEKLLKKMPKRIHLFGDGRLRVVDATENKNYHKIAHFQPLYTFNANCEGGEPWK